MSDVVPQVWVSDEPPDPNAVDPIEDSEKAAMNKPLGGMWTSSLRESDGDGVSSGWIEWMQAERYSHVPDPEAWILEPVDDVDVYVIDDVWDAKTIMVPDDKYENSTIQDYVIDWELVFEELDYDAIRLTRDGQIDTRFPNKTYIDGERVRRADNLDKYNLYGWDSECYLWDGWHFTDFQYAGEITIPEWDS